MQIEQIYNPQKLLKQQTPYYIVMQSPLQDCPNISVQSSE